MFVNGQPLLTGGGKDVGMKHFIAAGTYEIKIFYAYGGATVANLMVGIEDEDGKQSVMSSIGCSEFSFFRLGLLVSILLNLTCSYVVFRAWKGNKSSKYYSSQMVTDEN
jgi:hypothetical protein